MLDIVLVALKETESDTKMRRRTVPIFDDRYAWWTHAVDRRLGELRIHQKELAEHIKADPPAVSRCISREKPIYELLIDISDALGIPYPVVLPESEEEAIEIARQRRLVRRMAQVAQIKAGVPEIAKKDQMVPVPSDDVTGRKTKSRATSKGRTNKDVPSRPQRR